MKHFTRYIWFEDDNIKVEFTQHKSRQMFIGSAFYYNKHDINLVMSYDTIIGYIVDSKVLITWGYRTYSRTTSKQITQLLDDYDLRICKVRKFSYNDLEMLVRYLGWVA